MVLKNMINSEITNEERRKALRFGCKIPAKVVKLDSTQNFIERVTVLDFSRNGFRLSVNFVAPNPGARIELKLFLHKNRVSDLSPLLSLPKHEFLMIEENPLSRTSIEVYIPQLKERGLRVHYY